MGTGSIEESGFLYDMICKSGLNCTVLNAKNDEAEASVIAMAGMPGAVTISTNMAGRGTDIKLLSQETNNSGFGLYVIGTNRHESKRIDNQLRGRAGRQGEPGSSRFFISLEDDLFIKYNLSGLLKGNSNLNTEINRVQRIIEGQNLEIKKTLYKYSVLTEEQRKIFFSKRIEFLSCINDNGFFRLKQEG